MQNCWIILEEYDLNGNELKPVLVEWFGEIQFFDLFMSVSLFLMKEKLNQPSWCCNCLRDESQRKASFMQNMIEDRTESALSYYEFLLHLQQQISK